MPRDGRDARELAVCRDSNRVFKSPAAQLDVISKVRTLKPPPQISGAPKPVLWSDAFEMGDARIDAEHREFIDIVNRLGAATDSRETARIAELCATLVEHSAAHFRSEEEIMARHGYGGLDAHRRDHQRLLAYIREQAARLLQAASPDEHVEAAASIKDGLLGHMFRVDVHYKTHLLEAKRRPS